MSVMRFDGTVISSSQLEAEEWLASRSTPIMYGLILEVNPCDSRANYTALNAEDFRGFQHEAKVLVTDRVGNQPDLIITNVVIPPGRHSGFDNFEEDLPRGVTGTIDGSAFNDDLSKVDYAKLDGEWCMVAFVGGNIDNAVIVGWWPHPSNKYDLATSGNEKFGKDLSKTSLTQFDVKTGKSRFVRRINGTVFAINKEGTVYLDTSEANSSVKLTGDKYTRTLVDKGGHLQVDLCPKAQFEINWNEKEHKNPRIGAGSTAAKPVADVDLLHPDQPVSGEPKPRETTRTYIRGKAYELLLKTSTFSIFCEETEEPGNFIVVAHDEVTLSQRSKDQSLATAFITIKDGAIILHAANGDQISISYDQIAMSTKSGSQVSLVGDSILIGGAGGVSFPAPVVMTSSVSLGTGAASPAVLGDKLATAITAANNAAIATLPTDAGSVAAGLKAAFAALAAGASALSTQVKIGA